MNSNGRADTERSTAYGLQPKMKLSFQSRTRNTSLQRLKQRDEITKRHKKNKNTLEDRLNQTKTKGINETKRNRVSGKKEQKSSQNEPRQR
jgi:hypothetical protein